MPDTLTEMADEALLVSHGGGVLEFRQENARVLRHLINSGRNWLTAVEAHDLGLTSDLAHRISALRRRGLDIRSRRVPGHANWRYRPCRYRLATKPGIVWDTTVDGPLSELDPTAGDDERVIVASVPRSDTERVEVSLTKFRGVSRIDLRTFEVSAGGASRRTRRGVTLPVDRLPDLLSGVWDLMVLAIGSGLLEASFAPWSVAPTKGAKAEPPTNAPNASGS